MWFPNGGYYEGDFFNNLYHGYGKLEQPDKLYEGNWVLNKMEG